MLVVLIGFPPLFADYHRRQIENLAQRTGHFAVRIQTVPSPGEYGGIESGTTSAGRLHIAVDLWKSLAGNRWHVAKPASDHDAGLARAYHDAILREMTLPPSPCIIEPPQDPKIGVSVPDPVAAHPAARSTS